PLTLFHLLLVVEDANQPLRFAAYDRNRTIRIEQRCIPVNFVDVREEYIALAVPHGGLVAREDKIAAAEVTQAAPHSEAFFQVAFIYVRRRAPTFVASNRREGCAALSCPNKPGKRCLSCFRHLCIPGIKSYKRCFEYLAYGLRQYTHQREVPRGSAPL